MAFMVFATAERATHSRGFFARIGDALMRLAEAQARTAEVERLGAKSDAELARMGLEREDIVHHVFRDILYI